MTEPLTFFPSFLYCSKTLRLLKRDEGGNPDGSIDSIAGMKAALPSLKKKLYSDSAYFKKVYMHTFDMAKAPGSRTLGLETGQLKSPALAVTFH